MRLALVLLLATSCSRQGGAPDPGQSPEPGLLPLAVRATSFCRAGRALVAAGAAGFCTPRGASARRSVACEAREVATCGRCTLAACASATDCAAGYRCRRGRCDRACATEADCAAGEACRDGVCLSDCAAGCRPGERCEDGRCEAVPCRADGDCANGERCDLVREVARLVEPSVVAQETGGYLLAAEEQRPQGSRIVFGRSGDGAAWELDEAPALTAAEAWERGAIGAPALEVRGGVVVLYYEGGDGAGIGMARGTPTGAFVRDPGPLLAPTEPWEEGAVGAPAPSSAGLLYEAGRAAPSSDRACTDDAACADPRERCRAGRCRAVGRVIGLARHDGTRVLVLDPAAVRGASARRPGGEALWDEISAVYSPAVATLITNGGETLSLLFFAGVGRELPGGAVNRSIGLAVSRDGLAFRPYAFNPVLARLVLFTRSAGESGPWALREAAGLRLYYDATQPGGVPEAPGMAVSPSWR